MITKPCEALVLCLGSRRDAESPNAAIPEFLSEMVSGIRSGSAGKAALSRQDPSAPPLRAADPWGSPGGGGGCGTSLVPAFGTGVSPLLSSAAARGPLGWDVTLGGREAEPSPAQERSYELTETRFVLKQGVWHRRREAHRLAHRFV